MKASGSSILTIEDTRKRVSDESLAAYYLGIGCIPCLINSPLRQDRHPSFGIYEHQGKVYWKDFATGDYGSIYDLLCKTWGTTIRSTLDKINKDLDKINPTAIGNKPTVTNAVVHKPTCSDIQVKVREWRDYDIDYWASYGVPLKWLKYAEIYPISHKIIVKGDEKFVFGAQKYAYAYVERKDGKVTIKVYQPFSPNPRYKWSSKHDKSVISLWTKIPEKGERVVICSSVKDALCLWANTGIPAIAVQGEGYNISDKAVSELKRRFNSVYILFDNDNAGLADGKSLSQKTGFINLVLPFFVGGKDVSDLYKTEGEERFKEVINKLFHN